MLAFLVQGEGHREERNLIFTRIFYVSNTILPLPYKESIVFHNLFLRILRCSEIQKCSQSCSTMKLKLGSVTSKKTCSLYFLYLLGQTVLTCQSVKWYFNKSCRTISYVIIHHFVLLLRSYIDCFNLGLFTST